MKPTNTVNQFELTAADGHVYRIPYQLTYIKKEVIVDLTLDRKSGDIEIHSTTVPMGGMAICLANFGIRSDTSEPCHLGTGDPLRLHRTEDIVTEEVMLAAALCGPEDQFNYATCRAMLLNRLQTAVRFPSSRPQHVVGDRLECMGNLENTPNGLPNANLGKRLWEGVDQKVYKRRLSSMARWLGSNWIDCVNRHPMNARPPSAAEAVAVEGQ